MIFPHYLCRVLVFDSVSRRRLRRRLCLRLLRLLVLHLSTFVTVVTHIFHTHLGQPPSFTHILVTHHLSHTPSVTHRFVTPSVTHRFVTHYLSHTPLSHTIFHTQLCHTHNFVTHNFVTHHFHTQLCPTPAFTHNFVTHHLSHATLSHTWRHRPSICVARVALGDIYRRFAWQVWHFVLCGLRGTYGTGLALVARLEPLGRP